MSIPRTTLILTDLMARLQAAGTLAGANVERSRDVNLDDVDLPIILLFAKELEVREDAFLGQNRSYERGMKLVISAHLLYQDGLDDALYLIADQIEAVVMADESHGDNASQTLWEKTSYDWEKADVNEPAGWAALEFTVIYRDL
ncbi:MAG: hypothetical protein K9K65_11640 [Desulfarculaceae bacterium]|nr:hypothetical protein [Desulfarculaceae bacterium]MCF8064445.1 hypothetical protein [Desulfarculaceae bacterium]MCF8098486.1 hypothetical protein [Desulfarculaceae bacterium]MCF8122307.1 hypothetical protein [Desulfarculaceae bacterium]